MSALFAVTYPERTIGLILYGTFASSALKDDYPWGRSDDELEREVENIRQNWGLEVTLETMAPSIADNERLRAWFQRYV